jgi:hypothetical protein
LNSVICWPPYEIGPPDQLILTDLPVVPATGVWPLVDLRAEPATPGGRVVVEAGAKIDGTGISPAPSFMSLSVTGFIARYSGYHHTCRVFGGVPQGCGDAIFIGPSVEMTIGGPDRWALSRQTDSSAPFSGYFEGPVFSSASAYPVGDTVTTEAPHDVGTNGIIDDVRCYPPGWVDGEVNSYIINPAVFDGGQPPAFGGATTEEGVAFESALWGLGSFDSVAIDYGQGRLYGEHEGRLGVQVGLYWEALTDSGPPGGVLVGAPLRGVRALRRGR